MEDASIPDIIVGLIGSYLPTIFLVIYMSVILPMTIHWLVKTERYSNLTDETVSCLTKFLIFMIAHIFLAPTVGM